MKKIILPLVSLSLLAGAAFAGGEGMNNLQRMRMEKEQATQAAPAKSAEQFQAANDYAEKVIKANPHDYQRH